jgi:signal transduction histidine kinase
LPEKSPLLSIDAEKMSSVMKNLVSNAVKYSPDGGTIEIAGVVSGAVYQVSISDQGLGMTPEQVERVFEKFYRVDASNTSTEGTGLGMTIAKNIVEAHGGNIWIESELGQGTTVRFFIPMD